MVQEQQQQQQQRAQNRRQAWRMHSGICCWVCMTKQLLHKLVNTLQIQCRARESTAAAVSTPLQLTAALLAAAAVV
jgi:hypothetical protein